MLYLVGFGLSNEKGLTIEGLETLRVCDTVFMETYTSVVDPSVKERLEALTGKKITLLSREEVENGKKIVETVKRKDENGEHVALLVPGDPLIATTHLSVLSNVLDLGIGYKVIHSASVFSSAIGESGLHVYKFGPTVTIPKWYENYKPVTPYDKVLVNKSMGLHTVLLIDIFEGKNLPVSEVLSIFDEMEKMRRRGVFGKDTMLVVLSRLGHDDFRMMYVSIASLSKKRIQEHVSSPYAIIYPGELHFTEQDWLNRFRVE